MIYLDKKVDDEILGFTEGFIVTKQNINKLIEFLEEYDVCNPEEISNIIISYEKGAILQKLEVIEEYRGQGIGNELLESFYNEATDKGANIILLVAGRIYDNEFDLVQWYERKGYEVLIEGSRYSTTPIMYKEIE
jgi:GNAT superfamily N-acetyltransferase